MPSAGPRLLPWKPVIASYETLRHGGVPDEAYSREVLEAIRSATGREFVPWDLYLDLVDQARAWCKTDERYLRACEHFDRTLPEARAFISPGVDVRRFCRVVMSICDVNVFPGVQSEIREIGDDSMELEMRLPPESRDATAWLLGNIGALRTFSRMLGLPLAHVDAEIDPHHGRYRVRFPTDTPTVSVSEAERFEAIESLFSSMRDEVRLALRQGSRPPGDERLDSLARAWDLTARQRQVLGCLRRGLANREIGNELQCAEKTVERHITAILKKSGCVSRAQLVAAFVRE